MTFTNVLFMDFDHSDECEKSEPIIFRTRDNACNHFDYLAMFQNITMTGTKIMDASTTDQEGVKGIIIHDIDALLDLQDMYPLQVCS